MKEKIVTSIGCAAIMLLAVCTAGAQNRTIATNGVGWLSFGTMNAEIGYPVSRNFSAHLQGEYNPFRFGTEGNYRQFKHAGLQIGAKWWPWFVNSSWFLSTYMAWYKYSAGGIFSDKSYEGNAYGFSVGGGYAFVLSKNFNLEVGVGMFVGNTSYTKYSCVKCGVEEERKSKVVLAPSNVLLQLVVLL